MRSDSVEILIDFVRTVGLATTIAGTTILIGSIFLNPDRQTTAWKISGLSIGSGLILTGAALYEKRKLEVEPVENKYKKCVGCKYWNGEDYLVCAVHPEGVEGEYCKDWHKS